MLEMKQKHCLWSTEHHKDSVENEIANHKTWQRTITTCLKNKNLRFPSKIATMLTIKHRNDCVNVYFITINAIETFPVTTWHDHHDKAFQRGMVTCSLSLKHTGEVLPRKINTTALSYYIKLFAVTKRNSCKFFKPLKKWSTGDHAIGCLWTVGRVISKSNKMHMKLIKQFKNLICEREIFIVFANILAANQSPHVSDSYKKRQSIIFIAKISRANQFIFVKPWNKVVANNLYYI